MNDTLVIYTIGHSNHSSEKFVELLVQHAITCLVDVRSQPYSRYNPHFNRETLAATVRKVGIHYVDMGSTLGGRPDQQDLYDPGKELPNYSRQRQTELYQQGLRQLTQQAQQTKTVIMCSEGDPHACHRQWLITDDLIDENFTVLHIHPDGRIEIAKKDEEILEQLGFRF